MDREQALVELSIVHAVALRLRSAGSGDQLIAAALDVPLEAVGALLEVAEAKPAVLLCVEQKRGRVG